MDITRKQLMRADSSAIVVTGASRSR
jgi:hypothetical protein